MPVCIAQCNTEINPDTIKSAAFNNCRFVVDGRRKKLTGDGYERVEKTGDAAPRVYKLFDGGEGHLSTWTTLLVRTTPL